MRDDSKTNQRNRIPALVFAISLLLISCDQKFNTAAPYKAITIIYGFLDMGDTAHYIRVEKAYSDQNKSAFDMAQTPDSNFYASVNVHIERFDFSGKLKDTIHLNRVDLDLEGYPKQPGLFYTAPNYAYKFTDQLDPQYIYRLIVTNPAGETDSAETAIIPNGNRSLFHVDLFDYSEPEIGFAKLFGPPAFELSGSFSAPVPGFNFHGQASAVSVVEAIIRFNWTDSNSATQTLTEHYHDDFFNYITVSSTQTQFAYSIPNLELYTVLFAGMGPAPAGICRLLGKCDVFVYLATTEYFSYMAASNAQGTGLTQGMTEPLYTNIQGANALGLFTTRAFRTRTIPIDPVTIDSVMRSPIFAKTMIVGTSYH
jgi:hypothetical protein